MEIDIGNRIIILLLLLAASASLSLLFYRRTVPPVSGRLRYLLAALRFLSLAITALLLTEPVIAFVLTRHVKPRVAVLIDNSMSMGMDDGGVRRIDAVKAILKSRDFNLLRERASVETFLFADSLSSGGNLDPDSLSADGIGTDIGGALEAIAREARRPEAIILLTDGAENLGGDAARVAGSLGIPVHAVGIGSRRGRGDIRISKVSAPDVSYAGSELAVDITVISSGYRGDRVPVFIERDGKPLAKGELVLADNFKAQDLKIRFTPEKPGPYRLEVSIPPEPDEASEDNNRRIFLVKVLKSKLEVLLISGGPGPEFAFLKRVLERNVRINLTALVARDSSRFYGKIPPESGGGFDIAIILDLPHGQLPPGMEKSIVERVKEGRASLLVLGGPRLKGYRGTPLGELLPVAIPGGDGFVPGEFNLALTSEGADHALTKLSEEPSENGKLWVELPPVSGVNRLGPPNEGALVLATLPDPLGEKGEIPAITLGRYGRGKVLLLPFTGSWRWDLMSWGRGGTGRAYRKFWDNVISWLSSAEFGTSLRLSTDRTVYRGGEEIHLAGSLYDSRYQPIDGANVSVSISGDGLRKDIALEGSGSGRYTGRISGLPPGDYSFRGTAELGGRRLADASGSFIVEPYNVELESTAMDEQLLRQIAERSGGSFHTPGEFGELIGGIKLDRRPHKARYRLDLLRTPWVLVALIALVSLEWTIRRRKGMI